MAVRELQRAFKTWAVLEEVEAERDRQNEKWGEQNHQDMGDDVQVGKRLFSDFALNYKLVNDRAARTGDLDWTGILLEEVYEALAEVGNDNSLREELVQSAAVIVAWVEAIDRRAA